MPTPELELIKDVHRKFEAAFNAGDIETLVRLYEPNAVLLPGAGGEARGHEAIRAAFITFLDDRPAMRLETALAMLANDGIALMSAKWVLTALEPGAERFERRGVSAEVLRRQPDGRWLYILDNPFAA